MSGQPGLLACALLMAAACERSAPSAEAACRTYRPSVARRTFDGRVGAVLVRNASSGTIEVLVFHPDGDGSVELGWQVAAGDVLPLQGPDGRRLALGSDWGIQIENSCVTTLGRAAEWRLGEFALRWEGDSVRAGLGNLAD